MKISRSDLETVISFLCRRVSKSDVDYWKKLKRFLFWVKETIDDKIIIRAKSSIDVYKWVNSA